MNSDLVIKLAIVTALAMVTNKIVYFGYTPNYAADIFSRESFNRRFDHDVYKYRILSKYLLFKVDDFLGRTMPERGAEYRIAIQTPGGSERFYMAFYYLNTFFLILTSVMTVLLLGLDQSFRLNESERSLIMFLVPVVIGLTQFVVCCYDVSSYFFQVLIFYIFLKYYHLHRVYTIFSVCALLIISTLNRESSAISVSTVLVLILARHGIDRRTILECFFLIGSFLVTYIGLRYLVRDNLNWHVYNRQAGQLLTDTNIVGVFFWGLFLYLPLSIANNTENRLLIGMFCFLSLPYIVACLKDGVFWEVRLNMPVFIGCLFLSKIETNGHVFKIFERSGMRIFGIRA